MNLLIRTDGTVSGVYGEAIDLRCLGKLNIRRASHVEPDTAGQWWADLSLVSGPKLGPHLCRSHALIAEAQWLNQHLASATGCRCSQK